MKNLIPPLIFVVEIALAYQGFRLSQQWAANLLIFWNCTMGVLSVLMLAVFVLAPEALAKLARCPKVGVPKRIHVFVSNATMIILFVVTGHFVTAVARSLMWLFATTMNDIPKGEKASQ